MAQIVLTECGEEEVSMSGVVQHVDWQESGEALYARYRAAADVEQRKRLQALWLVRTGRTEQEAAKDVGVGRRTLTRLGGWRGIATAASPRCCVGCRATARVGQHLGSRPRSSRRSWRAVPRAPSAPTGRRSGGWSGSSASAIATTGCTICSPGCRCIPKSHARPPLKPIPPRRRPGKGGPHRRAKGNRCRRGHGR